VTLLLWAFFYLKSSGCLVFLVKGPLVPCSARVEGAGPERSDRGRRAIGDVPSRLPERRELPAERKTATFLNTLRLAAAAPPGFASPKHEAETG